MVGFLIFSGLLTGFIQVNIGNSIKADSNDILDSGYYVLDLNKNINNTQGLTNLVLLNLQTQDSAVKGEKNVKKINAIKLDKRTLVIKGFNETIDNVLLKTIDLNAKNIDNTATVSDFGGEIVPITLNMDMNDGVMELVDSEADIMEYEVVPGDTLSSIAEKFNISVETILWANDLNSKSTIKIGQKLVILPVSGLSYKVKSGDTVSALANRFNVSERDIVDFNKTENNMLMVGETIIIPGAKVSDKVNNVNKNNQKDKKPIKQTSFSGQFARPISGGIKTQGLHGYNGIDIGAPVGTSVFASLDGVVTLTRGGGSWNGGYGNYIVIKHNNGIQTLYAHLDSISVSPGQNVSKGQFIGKSGNTGRSTGPHLHFEVRGAKNPF